MYIHRTLTRHRRTEGLGLNTPSPQQGRENRNPDPDRGITSCAGGRPRAGGPGAPPTGTASPGRVPLAHAKGRQAVQSVAVSPHVTSPSDPAGSGVHSAAAPPGGSLRGLGCPGPREKAEGRGPRPAVRQRPLASSWLADDRRGSQAQARPPTPRLRLPGGLGAAA